MGYKANISAKIVRTDHVVRFDTGDTAKKIKEWLGNVPDTAVLKDIESEADMEVVLTFRVEEQMDEAGIEGSKGA